MRFKRYLFSEEAGSVAADMNECRVYGVRNNAAAINEDYHIHLSAHSILYGSFYNRNVGPNLTNFQ